MIFKILYVDTSGMVFLLSSRKIISVLLLCLKNGMAGNRTRAARVAGEHSTTEQPVLLSMRPVKVSKKPKTFIF
jgi:hypothetical protein